MFYGHQPMLILCEMDDFCKELEKNFSTQPSAICVHKETQKKKMRAFNQQNSLSRLVYFLY